MLRMTSWPDETDILYTISNKLTQASTPAEWLEAVSDYARSYGATSGLLLYLHMRDDVPDQLNYAEVVAVWVVNNARAVPVGSRYYAHKHERFVRAWMGIPDRPLLIPDVLNSPFITGPSYDLFAGLEVRGVAVLPLNVKGRWVAQLVFAWNEPFLFNEHDQRILTAIIQQAAPIIDSMRLYEKSRERAARVEHLLKINTALSQATDEAGILSALALYASLHHPYSLTFSYLTTDETGHPVANTPVAVWRNGTIHRDDPRLGRAFRLADSGLGQLWMTHPDQVIFIEDSVSDPRIDEKARVHCRMSGVGAAILIPLYSYGQWQGMVSIEWSEPRAFSASEKHIYTALLQTLPFVVASRRAYLAEEDARQERELLYLASKGINAARTFQEIVDALVRLDLNSLSIVLWIWDNYDFDTASHMELVAKAQGNVWPLGTRLPVESVPMIREIDRKSLIIIENTADRSQMDDVTAATTESRGYHALMSVPLSLEDRFMGLLGFESSVPRTYTDREKRLAAGIGDLVTAALERIRLRDETDRLAQQAQEMAALQERNRLARELHDSVSQALYGIALGTRTAQTLLRRDPTQLAEPLGYILSLAEAGLSEMRALIFELRPELLENEGLTVALMSQAFSLEARLNLKVYTELCDEPALPIEAKEALYRIAREALHNIVKHAQATRIDLKLMCGDDSVTLEITDDGIGFDPSIPVAGHLGLCSMRERATPLGGTFAITSAPGQGTRITVVMPHAGTPA